MAKKQLVTKSFFFYFCGQFPIFQGDIKPNFTLLSSANKCYSPLNTTWFGQFWPKPGAIKLSCTAVFLGNRILRRYFNRITISYECGKWLIRFAKKRMRNNFDCFFLSDNYLSLVCHGLLWNRQSLGGGGHHNFVVVVPMIMKLGTGIKLDVFYTTVAKSL